MFEESIVPVTKIEVSEETKAEWAEWEAMRPERERKAIQEIRQFEYQRTADPLFFGFQRGDNTEQEWLDAVQAVKDANPYPDEVEKVE